MRISDWSSDVCSSDLIMGVNELDPISATADDIDVPVFPYPLEQYLENSQTSRSQCGAGANGDKRNAVTSADFSHDPFARQLRFAVGFHRAQWRFRCDGRGRWDAVYSGGADVDDSFDPGFRSLLRDDACSVHIDIPIMESGVGLGDKRCIMMHNIHVAHGRCYAIEVKNAAIDERHVFRTRRHSPDVEQAGSTEERRVGKEGCSSGRTWGARVDHKQK